MTRFQALELSLDVITSLRQPVAIIGRRDRKLADEIRRAASSTALNLAEGRRRSGRDRIHHWRIASGSADEVRTALRVARAWGDVDSYGVARSLELLDRLLAMLWRSPGDGLAPPVAASAAATGRVRHRGSQVAAPGDVTVARTHGPPILNRIVIGGRPPSRTDPLESEKGNGKDFAPPRYTRRTPARRGTGGTT